MIRFLAVLLISCLAPFAISQSSSPNVGTPTGACDATGTFINQRWWLPLNFPKHQPADVQCFFGLNTPVWPITAVNLQYGFGSSPSTITVDAMSIQFPQGFQISFGSSLSGASTNMPISTATSSGTGTAPTTSTTPTTGQETPAQAIQQLQNGGDFYLRGIYPLAYGTNVKNNLSGFIATAPRLGFNVAGMSAQSTLTDTTEYNWNVPIEAYGQWGAIGAKGFLYGDAKTGYEYVTPDFATAIGLTGKNNFLLSSLSAGVQFVGFARFGFEYTRGPAQLSTSGSNEFNKWHLVIQLAPTPPAASQTMPASNPVKPPNPSTP